MPQRAHKKAVRFAFGEGGSVKTLVIRSGLWVGGTAVIHAIIGIVRSVVLARLLSPEIFGLMGIALIALRMFETVTRPGLAQALIARQQDFSEAAPTAFSILVMRGLALASLLALSAPWIGQFYKEPQLVPLLMALSTVFLIESLTSINAIAHQRNLDFRRLSYLSLVSVVSGLIVTIGLAYWLRSVWALVIGQIVSVSVQSACSYYFVGGRIRFGFDAAIARDLFRYGKFVTGSSVVVYVASELDSAVVGKILGIEQLGYYALALTVATLATANLSKVASSIMMPAYSKLQSDRAALRNAYLRSLELVLLLVMPAAAGLILLAGSFIEVVYGSQWLAATLPLQILAVFGLLRAMVSFSGFLFEGIGVPKATFQLGILRLLVIVPLIIPMIKQFGLAGAAITVTTGMVVQWVAALVYLRRLAGIRARRVAATLWRPTWMTILMSAAVFACTLWIDPSTVGGLILAVTCGVSVYGALSIPILRTLRRENFA